MKGSTVAAMHVTPETASLLRLLQLHTLSHSHGSLTSVLCLYREVEQGKAGGNVVGYYIIYVMGFSLSLKHSLRLQNNQVLSRILYEPPHPLPGYCLP